MKRQDLIVQENDDNQYSKAIAKDDGACDLGTVSQPPRRDEFISGMCGELNKGN